MYRLFVICSLVLLNGSDGSAQWRNKGIRTQSDFRGVSAVNSKVVWVSGTKGTVGRTIDGGTDWTAAVVAGAEKLDFRDVKAFGDSTAYLLSAGPGEDSRIYKTADAGKTWVLQFKNPDKNAFFDALAFWDEKTGIALSDPVRGQFQFVTTADGGVTWKPLIPKELPPALPNEGAFAASGTCLIARGQSDAWFVTGGAKTARIFHSTDHGQTWTVTDAPIPAGVATAGIFSIAFRDNDHGVIVGGDYKKAIAEELTSAFTHDGGKTWIAGDKSMSFRSSVVWAKDQWETVGTHGSNSSLDGKTWKHLDSGDFNALSATADGDVWAVGPHGRVANLSK
jgi:photosystem II stability/assembly factor-like uncharacterized protein